MMPIIKKWLYSDKDIFLREIVSNASDAITKYKKLVSLGEASEDERYQIVVTTDDKAGTLTVEDNGIGMTEEEVEKYITQIAFSGAADFLEKYEKAGGEGIIGHFGLGFYSAYMVSDNIEIFTKSYREGSKGVHWQSDGNSTYTIGECDKQTRGTKVVMHLAEGEKEFARESEVRKLLNKYCSFMPYEIFLNPKPEEELNKDLKEGEEPKKNTPVNTTEPLYLKQPKDCTEEEYKKFSERYGMDVDTVKKYLPEDQIKARIAELGRELTADYAGKNPIFIGVLKGVVMFFADMIRAIPLDCQIDFMAVSSYGGGTQSSGKIRIQKDISVDLAGRHVVILEDILDSGLTLSHTAAYLKTKGPASLKICTLLDKPDRRKAEVQADYVGFTIPNLFVVGYGQDFDENYRNLPYVGVLKPEAYMK